MPYNNLTRAECWSIRHKLLKGTFISVDTLDEERPSYKDCGSCEFCGQCYEKVKIRIPEEK